MGLEREIDHDSIDFAFERLRDFLTVTKSRPEDEKYEAGKLFASTVGMDRSARDHLSERMGEIAPEEIVHWVLLGSLVGLLIAQKEKEIPDEDRPVSE